MDVTAISNKQKVQTENKSSVPQSVKLNDEGVSFKDTISATQKNDTSVERNIASTSEKNITNPIENSNSSKELKHIQNNELNNVLSNEFNKVQNKKLDNTVNIKFNKVQDKDLNQFVNKELNKVQDKDLNQFVNKELNKVQDNDLKQFENKELVNVVPNKELDNTLGKELKRIPNIELEALEQEMNLIADINTSKQVKKDVSGNETKLLQNSVLSDKEPVISRANKNSNNKVAESALEQSNNKNLVKETEYNEKESVKLPLNNIKPSKEDMLLQDNKILPELSSNKKMTNVRKETKSKITDKVKHNEADILGLSEVAQTNKQIELKPLKKQEQKIVEKVNIKNIVDTDAVLTSFAETDRALSSSKTNDILKFIDTNLSTSNAKKTTKGSATGAASKISSKKSGDSINMTENDIKFFTNLAEKSAVSVDNNTAQKELTLSDVEDSQQLEVSKSLLNALKESRENNKSFRVDFDKDISVVLKVSRDGKISADFIPGDKAVEQYLKQNLPMLKQKFEEDGLEYDNLSYREDRKKEHQEERRNNRKNNKENGYE